MQVNDVLLSTCTLLGIEESVVGSPSSDEDTLSLLLNALNFVIFEIYEEHIPVYYKEKVVANDKVILYDAFTKNLSKVKSITCEGAVAPFQMGVDGLYVLSDGEYEVTYSYVPGEVGLGDAIDFPPRVSIRTVSYGVAGEYSLYVGRFDECATFDARFNSAISSSKRDSRTKTLKKRGGIGVL